MRRLAANYRLLAGGSNKRPNDARRIWAARLWRELQWLGVSPSPRPRQSIWAPRHADSVGRRFRVFNSGAYPRQLLTTSVQPNWFRRLH